MRYVLPALAAALLISACGIEVPTAPTPEPTVAPAAAPAPLPPEAATQVDRYVATTQAFLTQFDANAAPEALATTAQELLDLSLALLPEYLKARPACEDYLTAAMEISVIWDNLTLEAIERDYHHDGVLPTSDNTPACYHMKDLIVHPATVLALLAQPEIDREQVRAEIAELGAHAEVVKARP